MQLKSGIRGKGSIIDKKSDRLIKQTQKVLPFCFFELAAIGIYTLT